MLAQGGRQRSVEVFNEGVGLCSRKQFLGGPHIEWLLIVHDRRRVARLRRVGSGFLTAEDVLNSEQRRGFMCE